METIQDKNELAKELNEAVTLVNKVKTELLHYYYGMSNNPIYKTNCKVDHDRLNKVTNKLMSISESLSLINEI